MKANEYFKYCERMTSSIKRMSENDAVDYLSNKYPEANIFKGVLYGGMYDTLVAQKHNVNFSEFEDEYAEIETVIIL